MGLSLSMSHFMCSEVSSEAQISSLILEPIFDLSQLAHLIRLMSEPLVEK